MPNWTGRLCRPGILLLLASTFTCGNDSEGPARLRPGSDEGLLLQTAGKNPTDIALVASGGTWWAWDGGGNPGASWKEPGWSPSEGWKSVSTPAGYGEGYLHSIVSYGPDPDDKYVTTWFRTDFVASDPSAISSLELRVMHDDGFVCYLNGQEAVRASMPAGPVTAETLAFDHEAENAFASFDISSVKGSLRSGGNTLAFEVHQAYRDSSDLVFDASLSGRSGTVAAPPSQIHLGLTETTSSEIVVMWRTPSDTATSTVQYGTEPTTLEMSSAGSSGPVPGGGFGVLHTVTLRGLQSNTRYYYRCGDSLAGWSEVHPFRTAPSVVAAFGDQGTTSGSVAVADRVAAREPNLVLMLGDLSYAEGDPEIWDRWFDLDQRFAARAPFMPARGNHEVNPGDYAAYVGRFALPGNEHWYSFRVGGICFVSIDCLSPLEEGTTQFEWVADTLSAAAADPSIRWKIAFFHYPPFTSGVKHPQDGVPVRTHLAPLFDAYHVDIALAGHEHNYERTLPLLSDGVATGGSSGPYSDAEGTIYLVVGTGGKELSGFSDPPQPWSAARQLKHGFVTMTFGAANSVDAEFVSTDGGVRDAFGLSKSFVDLLPPRVWALAFANGKIRARAADNVGVARVEFWVDGALLASDARAPFAVAWPGAEGEHTITARAYDGAGNTAAATLKVNVEPPAADNGILRKSVWTYQDTGQEPSVSWIGLGYDDSAWPSGAGPLGYGESYIATQISYGPDPGNKYLATWFRRSFTVAGAAQVLGMTLKVMYDDGFAAYLNGTEILRVGLPQGSPTAQWHEAYNSYGTFDVSAFRTLLREGPNVLAVEMHQDGGSSSDLVFDAELILSR